MDRYYTIMVVPEKDKKVRSIRVPKLLFQFFSFFLVATVILISILSYDYIKILQEVYRNKHLNIENRQLKEQIQLFQMKINSLSDDLQRIQVFERKLRIITGVDKTIDMTEAVEEVPEHETEKENSTPQNIEKGEINKNRSESKKFLDNNLDTRNIETIKASPEYKTLKGLYEQKIATGFGQGNVYTLTKEWSDLFKQSFLLAEHYAYFDYIFNKTKNFSRDLEVKIHELDQYLLDKESFLRSTPTLLPAQGWITSYYGPRQSHYAMRVKMHEGLDIGARMGKPIIATADGIVTFSGPKPGFGNFVQIDHGYGVETIYAHAQSVSVRKGQRIKRGDAVATVGNTGYSTGPHVHYEIRVNEVPVDPLYFILD